MLAQRSRQKRRDDLESLIHVACMILDHLQAVLIISQITCIANRREVALGCAKNGSRLCSGSQVVESCYDSKASLVRKVR